MVFFGAFLYNGCMDKKKLLLIDGSSVAFRAFFALYQQLDRFKNAAGLHTNAIYGFQLMLSHLLERVEPSHILVAFDAGKTTFRTEMYADYKGGRAKTPDEFREQFPFIRELLDHMGIRHYELAQYEADDIIGTLDKLAEQDGFDITIVSGDKDLIQLTDEHTVVEISKKGVAEFEAFTPEYLMEKMGITPTQFIDLKALMGDKSDNIPGVTKIGEKTGIKLLLEHGSLEGIYENIDGMKASKMKENLINDKEQAFLSKTLATIDTKAPIEIGLQDWILADGKIHTRYVQDLTQTGRLSSVDPNLQNIPVRLEQGRLIRKAFVPEWEDSVLLSSDYSQIELRVLAHISKDEHLIKAFQEGADIHTSTVMRVFGIERPEDVTANDRRNAKAVNFGVVYGISDFGLSNNLGISRKEAKAYIDTYFERFPGIKNYMDEVVREARDKGYVETLFKRRRELPDINSRNFNIRGFAERTAINSPIQGSAADILKIAMIQLDKALVAGGYQTKMLLQVHDEIVLEVPKSELAEMKKLVKQTMEEAIQLSVPLIADENEGTTWYEAK